MDTVKFNCERCGRLMAVESADLGKRVECPHCHETVSVHPPAPPPPEPGPTAAEDQTFPELPVFHLPSAAEQESIFSPPEAATEDLFGSAPAVRLEMPEGPPLPNLQLEFPHAAPEPSAAAAPPSPPETLPQLHEEAPAPAPHFVADSAPAAESAPAAHVAVPAAAEPAQILGDPDTAGEIPAPPPPRRPQSRAILGPLLLIFLIPYSLVSTAAVGWLLYHQRRANAPPFDPLERLPDPKPGEGGPKRVAFDAPLPDKLKTALKQPLRVGDLEVTPLAVERTPIGELLLKLKLRNVARDVAFDPLPGAFLSYNGKSLTALKPYSFVALGAGAEARIYTIHLEYLTNPAGNDRRFDGILKPGQEEVVLLRTDPSYRPLVEKLDRLQGPILWRVQVRRGFVNVKGKDVSATAVVGVRIDRSAIPLAPAQDASRRPARRPAEAARAPERAAKIPPFSNASGKVACVIFAVLYNGF